MSLAEDPTDVLVDIREGRHEISSLPCDHNNLVLMNGLFQSAAVKLHKGAHFQVGIRHLAISLKEYPNKCSDYVTLITEKILPLGN